MRVNRVIEAFMTVIGVGISVCVAQAQSTESQHEFVKKVLELTNAERAKKNLQPLKLNKQLCESAAWHAKDMSDHRYFEHTDWDGRNIGERLRAFNYDWCWAGQNIAGGYKTPEAVVEGWMNSVGHRANIIRPQFEEIGISYFESPTGVYKTYWVQDFGTPRTSMNKSSAQPNGNGPSPFMNLVLNM